ncbi:MAG: hypothetical protein HUK03_07980, partial [Bacteroidaceae bacterium]|nr:hypothetical protein [Bacteroidaceae bacterium]
QTTETYTVSGKVESVTEISTQYGNATVVLEGGLTLFRFKDFNGANFTDANKIKVGDDVKVKGNLKKFVKDDVITPELVNGELTELNGESGGGGGGGGEVEGNEITFSAQGYVNAQDFDGQSIKVGDATLNFSKGSGSTTPKYYTTGTAMRLYGGNTLTVKSDKTIKKVEFTFADGSDASNRPYYATEGNSSITPESYDYTTQTWSGSANEVTLSYTASGGHFRILKVKITY